MHQPVRDYVMAHLPKTQEVVLEIGSRNINGGVRDLVDPGAAFVGYDLHAGPGVDVVGDFALADVPGGADLILCLEVFEHAEAWRQLVASGWRNLRPGGTFLMTCATVGRGPHSGVTGTSLQPGEFYANVMQAELDEELARCGFERFESEVLGTDLRAWAVK